MNELREIIEDAKSLYGKPLKDFTVLSTQRDPYRLDTAANHLLGEWLASAYEQVNPGARRLHLRGLHYSLVGRVLLPTGGTYENNDATWLWLSEKAAKAARYLGYLPWEALKDARNSPPQIFTPEYEEPEWFLYTKSIELKVPYELDPTLNLIGDLYRQPCRQIVIAEKSGVADVLLPVCERRGATLAMPTGEISDSMVYELLRDAAEDGRPVVIHQIGDFDPAGWQMVISTARTAQAIRDSQFPELDITVHPVALNRDHCEEWELPETPLKDTELRADRWLEYQGWQQTEIDAAIALKPREFAKVVDDSLLQYYDSNIKFEAWNLRDKLMKEANDDITEKIGEDTLEEIRTNVEEGIEGIKTELGDLNDQLRINPADLGLDTPPVPDVLIGETACRTRPLIDPTMNWAQQTQRLKARKDYGR